jgi:hypothetical protein
LKLTPIPQSPVPCRSTTTVFEIRPAANRWSHLPSWDTVRSSQCRFQRQSQAPKRAYHGIRIRGRDFILHELADRFRHHCQLETGYRRNCGLKGSVPALGNVILVTVRCDGLNGDQQFAQWFDVVPARDLVLPITLPLAPKSDREIPTDRSCVLTAPHR